MSRTDWPTRVAHLRAVIESRDDEPAFVEVAAQDLRLGDRIHCSGLDLAITGMTVIPDDGLELLRVRGELGASMLVLDFLGFEAVRVRLPRPPTTSP